MKRLLILFVLLFGVPAYAQTLTEVIETHKPDIIKGSVKTAGPIIADIQAIGTEAADAFLVAWQEKNLWFIRETEQIVIVTTDDKETYQAFEMQTSAKIGDFGKREIKNIKPNSGLRGMIGSALVAGQLTSPDRTVREAALNALSRDSNETHLAPLRTALATEADGDLATRMSKLERYLTIEFDEDEVARVKAIESFAGVLDVDVRAALNPLLTTRVAVASTVKEDANIAGLVIPGSDDLPVEDAYALLVKADLADEIPTLEARKAAIIANITDGQVGGVPVSALGNQAKRNEAYLQLASAGAVPAWDPNMSIEEVVSNQDFVAIYNEKSVAVTAAAEAALDKINFRVSMSETVDLILDGLSLASIYFLAAIGLAITFGVMRVINMAHGEFIMMGAYTGYVVQQVIANYTLSIVVALPLAFAVTFAAGVAMERLVIRHLYHRPLETLLATFGVSIALQQIAKNIFGTQARPLTAPGWLDGALVVNDVIQISWIRIAIMVLSLIFLAVIWLIFNKTRLGLETRAVTQNPRMAASMGINPDRINMLTFGLGSGIAGIAGVAIGLFAKVTSELGSDYIVQSFMTVVVGGVGNIWGTLAGAAMIGFFQKGIEWLNPSNTLAAQTYMIIIIIIFIQFRPRGIFALKGRAAGD
ncbi:MAG: urea ABC transporter permease subunit UrtB [Pseudomonadota bacterium]